MSILSNLLFYLVGMWLQKLILISQVHMLKDFCIYIQTMEKRKHILLKFILTISLLAVVRIMCHYSIPKNRGNAWAAAIRKMHEPTTIIIFFLIIC